MTISVNSREITPAMIEGEARHFEGAANPCAEAAHALAVRALLLDRASLMGLLDATNPEDDDVCERAIEALLADEVPVPDPTSEECRRYYDAHPDEFVAGELVEASHILFAVTPNAPLEAIRRQAEAVLRQAVEVPDDFGALAGRFSNCPSGAQGGNLGQLTRRATVPEFERAVFEGEPVGVLPRLVATRYGFHVVKIARREPGRLVPFGHVEREIADRLREAVRTKAAEQYVRILASRARITGIDLGGAASPLVQ
jgi:peptidyl-prolyl cis-trans isomerase C